jgi:hypothetical protein
MESVASRTRNRVLGIAAFIAAAAATVAVVLISQDGDRPRVTMLRETPTKVEQHAVQDGDLGAGNQSLDDGLAGDRNEHARSETGRRHELPPLRSSRRTTKPVQDVGTGGAGAVIHRPARVPAVPARPSPVPAPTPAPVPASPPTLPSPSPAPAPSEKHGDNEDSAPDTPRQAGRPIEIEIEDGELQTDIDRIHADNGHVRLHIRTDELLVVDVDDLGVSRPIPPGGEVWFEFDTSSTEGFEVRLRHRKGLLVLRLSD